MAEQEPPNLADALLAAQEEMPAVERDQENPDFKSKFASLDNLLSKVRPVLNRHGILLSQAPMLDGQGQFVLQTTFTHAPSGEALSFPAPLSPPKNDPQGQGSAITYMRRYTLAAALAIADQEDDDGQAGGQSNGQNSPQSASQSQKQGDTRKPKGLPQKQWGQIKSEAQRLNLDRDQFYAWLEWEAGSTEGSDIPADDASRLIELLASYQHGEEAMAGLLSKVAAEDKRAEAIYEKRLKREGDPL